ncbi:MAG TPA: rod shape-determining protein MreC [Oligoflexia bacterium]|nr:rod shape-determining protein MreC [Oligoflexia bacterium]HMP48665.1 rod shape-determining protein MreC [Oligoflexia bacterium]
MSSRNPQIAGLGWNILQRIIYPVQKLVHEVYETGQNIWIRYLWLQNVALEREVLLLQVRDLEEQINSYIEIKNENKRLRDLLQYKDSTGVTGVVGSVIGKDPSNWLMTLTIDKGANDQLRPGLPVVSGSGVVGQIAAVSNNSSTVLLIADSASSVGAMLQDDRAAGMVEGVFRSDTVRLSYVENLHGEIVKPGDRVITSGMDGIFPKGLLIGVIEEIGEDRGALFRDILVRPAVDFRRIESVTVLIPKN